MLQRVVFGLLLTADTFSPMSAFSSVLLPTFGAPHRPTDKYLLQFSFYK